MIPETVIQTLIEAIVTHLASRPEFERFREPLSALLAGKRDSFRRITQSVVEQHIKNATTTPPEYFAPDVMGTERAQKYLTTYLLDGDTNALTRLAIDLSQHFKRDIAIVQEDLKTLLDALRKAIAEQDEDLWRVMMARDAGTMHTTLETLRQEMHQRIDGLSTDVKAILANQEAHITNNTAAVNAKRALHQRYLRQLVERIGTINLAQINPDQPSGINLEDIYIQSPTLFGMSIELMAEKIVDWWITKLERPWHQRVATRERVSEKQRTRPQKMGWEVQPLQFVVLNNIQSEIDKISAENQAKGHRDMLSIRSRSTEDGVYLWSMLSLSQVAFSMPRGVILGAPGSGKSTFVRHLALCLAGEQLDNWTRTANLTHLDGWTYGELTPIYVELRRFVNSSHYPTDLKTLPTATHLWHYIEHDLLGAELRAYAPELRLDLEQGHAVLILDGLDEVPYPEGELKQRQQQLIDLARSLNTAYGSSRILVASRPYAYEGWTLPEFDSITITAFEDEHRIALAQRLYQATGLAVKDAQAQADALNKQLQPLDDKLKDRPLFVTLMATIYLKNQGQGLPSRRGALYRQSILLLLDRWTQSKPNVPSLIEILGDKTIEDMYQRLAALAYEVHETLGEKPGTPEISYELLFKHLKPLGKHVAIDLIAYLSENAGVLVCPGQDSSRNVFHFAHRTFQEYLAAAHIVRLCVAAEKFDLVGDLMEAKPQLWREPCQLVGDVLTDTERKTDVWTLVAAVLDRDIPDTSSDAAWWRTWLVGELAVQQELHQQTGLNRYAEQPIKDALIGWLRTLVETAQALPPPERAACGRALGRLGDPRPGVGLRADGLPAIEWIDIPAGTFWYGSDRDLDPQAYADETPRRQIDLPAFAIAKYPVTYRQYQAFLDAPDFDHPDWWHDLPPTVVKRYEQEWKIANHPRENVSWYQAVAYTRWLSVRLGYEVRLPTEFEWERAARGRNGLIYPYGNKFDATKANTTETGIDQTSAVGLFPDGAAPEGALDMSGNVWEWCLNKYKTPDDPTIDASGADRVLRGGAWGGFPQYTRAAFRNFNFLPHYWFYHLGFRLARSLK